LKKIVGVDVDGLAIEFAKKNFSRRNIKYSIILNEKLKYKAGSFDIIICNHVYEHTKNPQLLFNEIHRVLTKGGICYFGGPNKYNLIENHHNLPFLSFLPKKVANSYVRIFTKHKRYEENPKSYWKLKSMLKKFKISDYFDDIIKHPAKFNAEDMVKENSLKQKVALMFLRGLKYLTPSFVWILKT